VVSSSFVGPVADYYAEFRRGYPPPVIERLITVLNLDQRSRVLDLGCGTGQLAIPLAERTRTVLGVDIEADMLRLARQAAQAADAPNTNWLLGADSDLAALVPLLGEHVLDAVTIGQALHWMNPPQLFETLRRLVRPGGSVAVIANGTPLWLQSTSWSAAVRAHLEAWLGIELTSWCGTDPGARQEYRRALVAAGFDQIIDTELRYSDDLTFEQLVGSLYSAMSPNQLPHGGERERFEQQLRAALVASSGVPVFTEHVTVSILAGKCDGQAG
jgi:ubiquinone/menaquinone biosynthesis C-methylase UbiE